MLALLYFDFFWVCVLSTRYSAFFLIAPKRLAFAVFSLNFKIFYIYTHFFNTPLYLTLIFNEISNQRKRKLHLSYSPCFFLFFFNHSHSLAFYCFSIGRARNPFYVTNPLKKHQILLPFFMIQSVVNRAIAPLLLYFLLFLPK